MMYRANQRFQQGSLLALFYGDFQAVWLNTHGSFSPPPITLPIVLPIYLRMVCSAARVAENRPPPPSLPALQPGQPPARRRPGFPRPPPPAADSERSSCREAQSESVGPQPACEAPENAGLILLALRSTQLILWQPEPPPSARCRDRPSHSAPHWQLAIIRSGRTQSFAPSRVSPPGAAQLPAPHK